MDIYTINMKEYVQEVFTTNLRIQILFRDRVIIIFNAF